MTQRMHRWLGHWRALAPSERRVLVTAWLLMPVFIAGLHVLGLQRWRALLQRRPLGAASGPAALTTPETARLVNLAARRSPLHASCLVRSLLLEWMLRRLGRASALRIGVRLVDGHLDAHAWIEVEGVPINDGPDVASRYPPLLSARLDEQARFS
jgi:hypothetical protein